MCNDEPGGFYRFLQKAVWDGASQNPPMFTTDMLWDYFSHDVKQKDKTLSIFKDFEQLLPRLDPDDFVGLRILKAVSVFRVINPTRFKISGDILEYSLDIPDQEKIDFRSKLSQLSDHKNENRVLMRMTDDSYRTAVSNVTESIMAKIKKLQSGKESPLRQPVAYLNTIWQELDILQELEATDYADEFGVMRKLRVQPVSLYQLHESFHLLTKNIGKGEYSDGLLFAVLCQDSSQIETARAFAMETLADKSNKQIVLAIPKEPVHFFDLLMQHQALAYLKREEASLYAKGGELHEEWTVWDVDISGQLKNAVNQLFSPENNMLDYYWNGILKQDIINRRKLKALVNKVMLEVFPHCPHIGDDKLALDDFTGNWGYRKDCRDIAMKLTKQDAALDLFKETAAAPKHVINLLLRSNGILRKDQSGEPVIGRPDSNRNPAAAKVWRVLGNIG